MCMRAASLWETREKGFSHLGALFPAFPLPWKRGAVPVVGQTAPLRGHLA